MCRFVVLRRRELVSSVLAILMRVTQGRTPRGVKRSDEPWAEWWPALGPSAPLRALMYGKRGEALPWDAYRQRYLAEMKAQHYLLRGLRERVERGETMTLLCSSACTDPARCHRTLLRDLVLDEP